MNRHYMRDWKSFSMNEAKKSYTGEQKEAFNDGWNVGFNEAKKLFVGMMQDLVKDAKSKDSGDVM